MSTTPFLENQRTHVASVRQPLTTFVGREQEVATVTGLLRRPEIRLVTVTGAGGVGKTRLTLRAAEEIREVFDDGAVVVPLASVRDPAMLLPTVAHLLDVPDAPGQPLISRLRAFLAERNVLLVLDNVEHLLDAVPAVVDLLAACPRLTILSTCRTNLNVSGEHLVPLAPLPMEEARRLFLERVRALVPNFTLSVEQVPVIDAICARLDGLPLAIELAASRVPALPPRALLTRLERRLNLLTNGPRDAPSRLRNMRDAIGWSHDLLPLEQQLLFRRLGVFIGGCTLEAVEAVAGGDIDVFEGMSALITANLVVPTEGVADEPRYTMLETIREYALERLAASGDEGSVRARHAEYYRSLAEIAIPHYDGPDLRIALDRIGIELDNCRAAMTWALETQAAELGTRLAGALWRVWHWQFAWPIVGQPWTERVAEGQDWIQFTRPIAGQPWMERVAEGQDWIERMLAMQDGLPVEALAEALTGAGLLARLQGNIDRAQAAGEDLLARAQAERYPYGEFWAIFLLGMLAEDHGQFESARSYYARCLTLARDMRNPQNHLSIAHMSLGSVALRIGEMNQAALNLGEALKLSYQTKNTFVTAEAGASLGRVMREQGSLGHAAALARESLVAYMERGALSGVRASLIDLVPLAMVIGQPERATRLLGMAGTFPSDPAEEDAAIRAVSDVKSRLGEAAFATALEAGRNLAWDAVLAEIDALTAAASDAPALAQLDPAIQHGLSRRETEVLRLLAEGHSNRAIAETLSLSERTVENHVFHIFNKLSVNSRAAAATYAVRHGLL